MEDDPSSFAHRVALRAVGKTPVKAEKGCIFYAYSGWKTRNNLFQRQMSLSGHSWRMIVTLNTQPLTSLAEVRVFLEGSTAVGFPPPAEAGR